jgi:hypothetical protein
MDTTSTEVETELKQRVSQLEEELHFMKSLWADHSMSIVCHMYIKTKSKGGHKVWINCTRVTESELMELDPDDDVRRWIDDSHTPFSNQIDTYT